MRTDLRTRVAGVAASATVAGALVLGAAAPAFAAVTNPVVTEDTSFTACAEGQTALEFSVAGYNSDPQSTQLDETSGLQLTFTKNGGGSDVTWVAGANTRVQSIFMTTDGGSAKTATAAYDPAGQTPGAFSVGNSNQFSGGTVCYTVYVPPTQTPAPTDGTPPPTSTVASTSQDNGAWKLALVGVGGILATLAVVTPRRFRKNS